MRPNVLTSAFVALAFALAVATPSLAHAEEVAPAPPPRSTPHVHATFGGGYSYGQLFGIGLRTTAIEGGLAIDMTHHFAFTVGADVELGKTTLAALPAGDVALFTTFDGVFGRLRVGAGPQLSYFWMGRAPSASGDASIDAFGIGGRARLSYDVLRLDDDDASRGLFVAVSPGFEWLRGNLLDFTSGTVAWRANATIGLRL